MLKIKRTVPEDPEFVLLVQALDADLAEKDGDDHAFYDQFNKIVNIKYAVVAFENGKPVGCGAMKTFAPETMEIKRMYTSPASRAKGIATGILHELELWAKELSCKRCVLETGKRQPEAIRLYRKNGYRPIPNYGQYAGIDNSICFEKVSGKAARAMEEADFRLAISKPSS